ncbi:MAG: coproporphyrinogen-III oxidase family protein [Treponema sp.]|uniref:coproporphyrinogen-III oxidase family protein n=1 Tax=Treponema sp. TaxID=166 RepID=UPI003FA2DE84
MYLYVHIPFCKSKCSYCDFFSVPLAADSSIPDSYIEALLNEAAYRKHLHGISIWSSIYLGGGTPGLLSPAQLKRLLEGLYKICPPHSDAEITLEVNCADIAEKNACGFCSYLEEVSALGVNRISAGIQSFNDRALRAVGRRSSSAQIKSALENLRQWRNGNSSAGARFFPDSDFADRGLFPRTCASLPLSCRRFSCDLIAGLPYLSTDDFCAGLHELIGYEPDHISLYSLMIEAGTPLEKQLAGGLLDLDEEAADEQWLSGRDILEKAGYRQYEVSNFAKAGFESVHNRAYWQMKDYIGIGCAAVGTVGSVRYTGTRDIKAYTDFWTGFNPIPPADADCFCRTADCYVCAGISAFACEQAAKNSAVPESVSAQEHISADEAVTEFLMMGFRLSEGISASEFKKRFGLELKDFIEPVFSRWQKRRLAETDSEKRRLTKEGLLFLNEFLAEILSI